MNELDKLNIDYTARRLELFKDKKYLELQNEIGKANANMIEYLKTQIPEELNK